MTTPQERLDSLAKPPGSLGLLEAWATKLCLAQETLTPTADPASILVFCGDHGVKAAHAPISPFPPSVSQAVFRALVAGISATGVLAAANGAHLTAVDVGIDGDVSDLAGPSVRHAKVERGTADFRSAAAMDEAAFERALAAGRAALAAEVEERGARVVGIGEVGIGNTTAAACCLAMLLDGMGMPCDDPGDCVGRGTGVDDDGMEAKRSAVREACSFHREAIEAEATAAGAAAASSTGGPGAEICAYRQAHARAVLRRLGGFEFVAMTGAFLEAAERRSVEARGAAAGEAAGVAGGGQQQQQQQHFRVVTVVDGFLSAVAALAAARMADDGASQGQGQGGEGQGQGQGEQPTTNYALRGMVFATELAEEPTSPHAGGLLAKAFATFDDDQASGGGSCCDTALSMQLRLGEASAATMALPLLRSAAAMVSRMGTLQEAMALGSG